MTKKEITAKGLELVAFAGEARGDYMYAVKLAQEGKFDEAREMIKSAGETLTQAHIAQTELLQAEAQGKYSDITLIMVHGQDHLMTTILMKDIVNTLVELLERTKK